ncbi:sugar ABC transporter substrate-binding protein [Agathobaculum sp.]|uniref:sugar ABC transporter substrate-binding protein n=1 Tax=Agathobaculum sp. TaxID=2048138 RepID=UPI002A832EFB|nr:sugar ABC transporter substrate-binding protein [Agathobaculum sp.]MDY3619456.1 sugar ABC transporter substrate-binding protein [Agathobaculum sp.]
MKKKLLAGLLAAAMAFSLTACGSEPAPADPGTADPGAGTDAPSTGSEKVHVGFVVKSLADQYWVLVKAGAEAKAAELGNVELEFIAPNSESDVQMQVDMIQNLVGKGIDVLCLAPSSPDTVLPVLQQADEAGIKVLAVDTDLPNFDKKVSFIGTGNEDAGKIGGEFAAKKYGEGANAVILRGRAGDTTHDQREAGIRAGLEAGGVNILEVKAADSESEKAMNIMQDLMNRYDNIDVVVTTADSMAQGAERAISGAGKNIGVIGFDGTIPVCEIIADGSEIMLGTVAQSPYKMGELGVENAVKVANGETIDARIDSGAEMVSSENAADFVANLKSLVGE